jgi:hypothetical protein
MALSKRIVLPCIGLILRDVVHSKEYVQLFTFRLEP